MKHPLAHLLSAAAEDKDAKFNYSIGMAGHYPEAADILTVLIRPLLDWKLVEKTKPELWTKEKEAHKQGKVIEWRHKGFNHWSIAVNPKWLDVMEYRIKHKTETRWQWRDINGRCCSSGWYATAPSWERSVKLEYTAQEFEVEVTE